MEKYENLGLVGEGSYGMVMKCRHKETSQLVAIKKFLETENDKMVKKIALREVKMLKQLRHENLVNLIEVFRRKKRLFLVFEFVDRTALDDLEKYPTGADENYVKKVMWQVLKGIDFCHTHNVIHRDIKPENILISKRGVVKICDFGFARLIAPPGEAYTDYVATRWYRGPELLVGDTNYGKTVDVWAVGCLFSEMLTGEPLFPGESDIDQLYLITKCFGNLIAKHREIFSRNPLFIGMRLPEARELEPLERRYPRLSSASMDIIKWSLRLDPGDRPSCAQLLRHELFTKNSWADKFSSELRSKIHQEMEENPLLKNLGIASSSDNESLPRQHHAPHPKVKEPVINGRQPPHPPMDRLSVFHPNGANNFEGFSSGTEALYSGTEDLSGTVKKKEKKKKVKKETVLLREKAHPEVLGLKPSQSPHPHTFGTGGMGLSPYNPPRSPHGFLHKPATPIMNKPATPIMNKPSTPRNSKNYSLYQQDNSPLMTRQLSNNAPQSFVPPPMMSSSHDQQPAMYSLTRIKDLHSTSGASITSQHESRTDLHGGSRMDVPLPFNNALSPSHPPPYKKQPSGLGLPQLADQHTSSLVANKPLPLGVPSQQSSFSQLHHHNQQLGIENGHHQIMGSGSHLNRGGGANYLGGLKMEQQPPSPAKLRRTQEGGGTGQAAAPPGYHLVPYN